MERMAFKEDSRLSISSAQGMAQTATSWHTSSSAGSPCFLSHTRPFILWGSNSGSLWGSQAALSLTAGLFSSFLWEPRAKAEGHRVSAGLGATDTLGLCWLLPGSRII